MAFYISGPKLLFNCTLLYRLYDVLYFIILLYSILYWCILQLRKKKLNKKKKQLLFETTEISTQQESNYIYLYTTKFGTSIKIRLNRKFESTEFETMRVNCISIILSPNLRLDLNQIWAQIMLCLLFIVEKAVFQLHWATCLFNVCCMFQYDALPVLQFGRPQYISHRQEVTSQSNTILPAIKKKYMYKYYWCHL